MDFIYFVGIKKLKCSLPLFIYWLYLWLFYWMCKLISVLLLFFSPRCVKCVYNCCLYMCSYMLCKPYVFTTVVDTHVAMCYISHMCLQLFLIYVYLCVM